MQPIKAEQLFDVFAVEIPGNKVLWVERDRTERNADAIVRMAIMRQGVEDRFFAVVQAGRLRVDDVFTPEVEHAADKA